MCVYIHILYILICIYIYKHVHQASIMLLPNLPPSSLPGVSSQNTDSSRRRESTRAHHDGFTWWLTMIPVALDHASLFMVSFIIEFVCIYCFFFVASGLVTFNQTFFSFGPYHGEPLQFDNMFHLVWIWNHHLFSNLPSWSYSRVCVCLSH